MSEIACVEISTSTELLKRASIAPDLEESVENAEPHCLVSFFA